ncbi:DVU_1555 family C-GCAxxG-C-C protein [Maridesulfovibrio ferrireducens]|uniref:DVU_1555 family C-GCAxxG-C-C protein n=1 Tax=Maridesulfovibrio ferrireducens TaxID=246191 RepID=UPI001A1E646E|nr:DV_1555 family C-GCAxxG-C-C protein [Maridesulfovibrio ferrireducens]MBI9112919.1 C_GCAxxG_C_C family protein [Maridesulfovibrio ferrireducens]
MNDTDLRILQLNGSGYCCAQIITLLCLENLQRENPDLVRSMQGLCLGTGDCSGTCGILTGGICALALYGGKGLDNEEKDDRLPLVIENFREWFKSTSIKQYGGISCGDIIGDECGAPKPDRCGKLLVDAYAQLIQILVDEGFDPYSGRETNDGY